MKKQISYARHLLNVESVSILMVVGIALSVLWISDIDFTGWEAQEDPVINQEDEDFEELPTASDTLDEYEALQHPISCLSTAPSISRTVRGSLA